jgi:UDPglucose 6-dehydrogenase
MANICEKAGADIKMVAYGIGLDSRIGTKFLNAGIGWGGSCFPKDVLALTKIAAEYGISTQLLNSVVEVNNQQRLKVINKAQEILKIVKGKTIGILGISFKPNTDDMRDAPSITIMNNLINLGAKVKTYDPVIKHLPPVLNSKVIICNNVKEIFEDSDLVILTTEWDEFKGIDFKQFSKIMKDKNLIDGRNFLDKKEMLGLGYNYTGIGR